jgi:hypothetical protein
MLIQKQPNSWSCVLTAFANALDIDQNELIKSLGHDGSKIIFPDHPDFYNRQGFDPREFVYYAAERDITIVQLDIKLERVSRSNQYFAIDMEKRMYKLMQGKKGVITGDIQNKFHAEYWNGIDTWLYSFNVDCFYWIKK